MKRQSKNDHKIHSEILIEQISHISESKTLWIVGAFASKDDKSGPTLKIDKNLKKQIEEFSWFQSFKGTMGQQVVMTLNPKFNILFLGLGKEDEITSEKLRRTFAGLVKGLKGKDLTTATLFTESFLSKNISENEFISIASECIPLAEYDFLKYKTSHKKEEKKSFDFIITYKSANKSKLQELISQKVNVARSMNFARDLVNECPMVLHATEMAKRIADDVKANLKNVKVTILDKKAIEKEKMNLLLAVNAGSTEEPRFIHLHYRPTKPKNKKHIALVGKGVTYDTGGYSLKPATGMAGMKGDMAGAATVYGAFRAAILNGIETELSCVMVLTDNKVNGSGVVPDAIITARSGKTVEILNTDAEGRLILADAMDYTCDLKPDVIVDAATLTGAMIVSLGVHVCGLFSNNDELVAKLKASALNVDEYLWQLPIVQEYRDDMKSKIADIKNIGSPGRNGSASGALFIEAFVKNNIPWAHLDIAGVADSQTHLPYCSHGASALMVRTLVDFMNHY
ncbi:MAG: leucyl aminopeptidase [Bacteriovoracaceae bacterium]|nr:leucyl aminopeptidase [Bacteriovoracaceae bacterium]